MTFTPVTLDCSVLTVQINALLVVWGFVEVLINDVLKFITMWDV